MADKRKPECRIIIEESRRRVSVELFPARLFPGGEQLDGQYRVRVGRAWLRSTEQRYVFLSYAEVFGWLISLSEKVAPSSSPSSVPVSAAEPRPDLERGCRRRLLLDRPGPDGQPLYEGVVVMTDPLQGPDGRWRVFLVGRREPVLASSLC